MNLGVRCKARKENVNSRLRVQVLCKTFHVADLPKMGKKCTKIRKARDGRGKLLFLLIKYAKIATLCPKHIRSYTKASYLCCFKLELVYIVSIYDLFIQS